MKKSEKFKLILSAFVNEYEKFHEHTKTHRISRYKSSKYWPKATKKIYYKGYGRMLEISLPKPAHITTSLQKALAQRVSNRDFIKTPLSLQQISTLLYHSAGIKPKSESRFYPSAGARFPLEIYILSINSELAPGLYHYYVKNNSLEQLLKIKSFKSEKYFVDTWIKNASIVILISGVFKRSSMKYGEKGYRYTLIEAGHLAQNISLVSSSLHISCCEVGGFIDDRLHKLIDIDGKDEALLTTLVLGKSPYSLTNKKNASKLNS